MTAVVPRGTTASANREGQSRDESMWMWASRKPGRRNPEKEPATGSTLVITLFSWTTLPGKILPVATSTMFPSIARPMFPSPTLRTLGLSANCEKMACSRDLLDQDIADRGNRAKPGGGGNAMIPEKPPVLIPESAIRRRVEESASEVSADYEGVEDLILVGVLRGGFIFLADLSPLLTIPRRIHFLAVAARAQAVDPRQRSVQEPELVCNRRPMRAQGFDRS